MSNKSQQNNGWKNEHFPKYELTAKNKQGRETSNLKIGLFLG